MLRPCTLPAGLEASPRPFPPPLAYPPGRQGFSEFKRRPGDGHLFGTGGSQKMARYGSLSVFLTSIEGNCHLGQFFEKPYWADGPFAFSPKSDYNI